MARVAPKYLIPQFMLAHFSHHVCTGVLIPLLPLLRESFGLNYFQSGILVSCFSISYGIGQVPLAILADRYSRRLIIILGLIVISFTGMGVSLTRTFWQMVPFFIAMGIIGGTYHAPASSFISQALPASVRGRALGTHVIGGSASFFLTPAMALGLATLFSSWRASFFILALPALLVGIVLWLTTQEREERRGDAPEGADLSNRDPAQQNLSQSAGPVSWVWIIRSIGLVVLLSMVMQVVFASVNSYLPLYMVDHHGISPQWAGIVISLIAGTGIIGAPVGGALSDRFGRKGIILFCITMSGPLFLAVTRASYGLLLFLALILYGFVLSMRMPVMESLIADMVPVGRRTTVLGIYFFLGMETAGLATPVVGRIIDGYGLGFTFTGLGLGLCLVAVLALLVRKKL